VRTKKYGQAGMKILAGPFMNQCSTGKPGVSLLKEKMFIVLES